MSFFNKVTQVKEEEAARLQKIADEKAKAEEASRQRLERAKRRFDSLFSELETNGFSVTETEKTTRGGDTHKVHCISRNGTVIALVSYYDGSHYVTYSDDYRDILEHEICYIINGELCWRYETFENILAGKIASYV